MPGTNSMEIKANLSLICPDARNSDEVGCFPRKGNFRGSIASTVDGGGASGVQLLEWGR